MNEKTHSCKTCGKHTKCPEESRAMNLAIMPSEIRCDDWSDQEKE